MQNVILMSRLCLKYYINKVCNQRSNNSSKRLLRCVCVAMTLPPIHGLNQTQTMCGISIKPSIVRTQYIYMHSYPIFCMQYLIEIQRLRFLKLIKEQLSVVIVIGKYLEFRDVCHQQISIANLLHSNQLHYLSLSFQIYQQTLNVSVLVEEILASTRLLVIFPELINQQSIQSFNFRIVQFIDIVNFRDNLNFFFPEIQVFYIFQVYFGIPGLVVYLRLFCLCLNLYLFDIYLSQQTQQIYWQSCL